MNKTKAFFRYDSSLLRLMENLKDKRFTFKTGCRLAELLDLERPKRKQKWSEYREVVSAGLERHRVPKSCKSFASVVRYLLKATQVANQVDHSTKLTTKVILDELKAIHREHGMITKRLIKKALKKRGWTKEWWRLNKRRVIKMAADVDSAAAVPAMRPTEKPKPQTEWKAYNRDPERNECLVKDVKRPLPFLRLPPSCVPPALRREVRWASFRRPDTTRGYSVLDEVTYRMRPDLLPNPFTYVLVKEPTPPVRWPESP